MDDQDKTDKAQFMAFLDKNATDIQENWPKWKADAFRLVRADGAHTRSSEAVRTSTTPRPGEDDSG